MKFNLTAKIFILLLSTVILLTLAQTVTMHHYLMKGLNKISLEEMKTKADAVDAMLKETAQEVKGVTFLLSTRPDLIEAIREKNSAKLLQIAKLAQRELAIEFVTIADASGIVLARGHSDKTGDSIKKQINVQRAEEGLGTVGLEEGTAVKFSLRAGYPVRDGNTIIGTITTGVNLSSSNAFVDKMKKDLGVECTFFFGDTRVATTLERGGKRIVGSRMDNPAVIETVLRQGKHFLDINKIAGQEYNTAYWPIIGANGAITGMVGAR